MKRKCSTGRKVGFAEEVEKCNRTHAERERNKNSRNHITGLLLGLEKYKFVDGRLISEVVEDAIIIITREV